MVVINTDSVFDSTVLLCGPQSWREVDGKPARKARKQLTAKHENGWWGEFWKEKELRQRGRVGGEVVVGVAENRRRKDTGERRGEDWIKCLNQLGADIDSGWEAGGGLQQVVF